VSLVDHDISVDGDGSVCVHLAPGFAAGINCRADPWARGWRLERPLLIARRAGPGGPGDPRGPGVRPTIYAEPPRPRKREWLRALHAPERRMAPETQVM
jgi:hypothetical protein